MYAVFTDELEIKNTLRVDTVDISLNDYMLQNGQEVEFIAPETILPNLTRFTDFQNY